MNLIVSTTGSIWIQTGWIMETYLPKKLYREKVKKYFLRDSIQQAQAVFWLNPGDPADAIRRQHSESKSSKRFHFRARCVGVSAFRFSIYPGEKKYTDVF